MKKYFILIAALLILQKGSLISGSPYELSWEKDGWTAGTGVALGLTAYLLNTSVEPLTNDEISGLTPDDINPFERATCFNYSEPADKLSDILLGACVMLPGTLLFDENIRGDFTTVSAMYIENIAFSYALPFMAKSLVQRTRPYVYNTDVPIDKKYSADSRRSFFSGHATFAFSSAVFFSKVYSDYYPNSVYRPYIWGGSLLLASVVGYLRYEAGKHFPTDIITGALVGGAIGYLIPEIHRTDKNGLVPDDMSYIVGQRAFYISVGFNI